MRRQITRHIAMVRPIGFYFNGQTAANDFFQHNLKEPRDIVQAKALLEFDAFVAQLRAAGVKVSVFQDVDQQVSSPDSIFPNNWFVSLGDGVLALCPMFAPDRRTERLKFLGPLVEALRAERFEIHDYTAHERHGRFLEGTGAMVLDRVNRIAYACVSPRADKDLFVQFCKDFDFEPVAFHGFQSHGGERAAIYHTNVMMALGEDWCAIALDAIDDPAERASVRARIEASGKQIVPLSEEQINHFAGNEIELEGASGKRLTIMSASTRACLTPAQVDVLGRRGEIVAGDVATIETYGGGSVRCMISELF